MIKESSSIDSLEKKLYLAVAIIFIKANLKYLHT